MSSSSTSPAAAASHLLVGLLPFAVVRCRSKALTFSAAALVGRSGSSAAAQPSTETIAEVSTAPGAGFGSIRSSRLRSEFLSRARRLARCSREAITSRTITASDSLSGVLAVVRLSKTATTVNAQLACQASGARVTMRAATKESSRGTRH